MRRIHVGHRHRRQVLAVHAFGGATARVRVRIVSERPAGRGHDRVGLRDGEARGGGSDVVIRQHARRRQRGADGVAAGVLTRRAAVACGHTVGRHEPAQGTGQGRVGVAVGLALGLGCHRRGLLVDVERRRAVGDVVVAEHRRGTERRADRVRTDRLAHGAAVGRRHAVGRQEPIQRAREGRVGAAVDLALAVGRDRGTLLGDLEGRRVGGDVVVAEHRRGT